MENSKILDIMAYYLSEYDMEAIEKLGFSSRAAAFREIGAIFGKNNNYLKRLRDEYDVVTSSYRNGQCNRPPRERIIKMQQYLSAFSFDEITDIVLALMQNKSIDESESKGVPNYEADKLTEEEIEYIINFKDSTSKIQVSKSETKKRVYNTTIIKQLKRLNKGKCQICGKSVGKDYNVDVSEVHHMNYFSKSYDNDASNLIVLCPDHHRLIHKLNPKYDEEDKSFVFSNGKRLKITIDHHLGEIN